MRVVLSFRDENRKIFGASKPKLVAARMLCVAIIFLFLLTHVLHKFKLYFIEGRDFPLTSTSAAPWTFFIPEGCSLTDTRVLSWKLLLNHARRVNTPHLASFALLDKECVVEANSFLISFASQKRLIAVERDPTQNWKKRSIYKTLGLENVRYAVTNCREPYFRVGHDICIALRPKTTCTHMTFFEQKKYHATFKGTGYFRGYGHHRFLLKVFHNPSKGVIVALTTRHVSNDRQIQLTSSLTRIKLDTDEREANVFEYCELMNSTYSFTPGGRSPASYRLLESMHSGAIPLLLFERGDEHVSLPYGNIIDWQGCLKIHIFMSEIEQTLLDDGGLLARKTKCAAILTQFFLNDEVLVNTFLQSAKHVMLN